MKAGRGTGGARKFDGPGPGAARRVTGEAGRGAREMERYCPSCACTLRGLRMRCPDCHRSTIGWLHVALIAALDAAGLIYLSQLV